MHGRGLIVLGVWWGPCEPLELEHALRINPDNALTLGLLGDISSEAGDITGAARHYRRILELNPANQLARSRLRELDGLPTKGIGKEGGP